MSAGYALKSKDRWNGSNKNGFSAIPSGSRNSIGKFAISLQPNDAIWWTSTEGKNNSAKFIWINNDDGEVFQSFIDKGEGYPVRCIKDKNIPKLQEDFIKKMQDLVTFTKLEMEKKTEKIIIFSIGTDKSENKN